VNDPPRIVCRSNGSKDVPILKKAQDRKPPRKESNLAVAPEYVVLLAERLSPSAAKVTQNHMANKKRI
jgi:hypothetical protein